ncbi:hypothetical protein [Shewanella sp. SG41-3]|nr:hypothetical protein [Shewanella sp. SG41-3]
MGQTSGHLYIDLTAQGKDVLLGSVVGAAALSHFLLKFAHVDIGT